MAVPSRPRSEMASIAIRAEGLAKHFRLGRRHRGLRERWSGLVGRTAKSAAAETSGPAAVDQGFWALRDVHFEVHRGEVLGIVGRNGAGKSTLLKILSRITEPTRGRAEICGRVGSLLEVGTGFHPELSGRENVYLNGAILGMKKAEIAARFDEIVSFAGVERFLDTPVKRYSSGMRMRLGFAVAAHLQTEILIIDEVLAVGDEEFQQKCMGKMSDVAGEGRTVLFVSHNLAAVRDLCSRALLLEQGAVLIDASPDEVIETYRARASARAELPLADRADRGGNGRIRFTRLEVRAGEPPSGDLHPVTGQPVEFALSYVTPSRDALTRVVVALTFVDEHGGLVFTCDTRLLNANFPKLASAGEVVCRIPRLPLASGRYRVNLWSTVADEVADQVESAAAFFVEPGSFYGTGRTTIAVKHGAVLVDHEWTIAPGGRDRPAGLPSTPAQS